MTINPFTEAARAEAHRRYTWWRQDDYALIPDYGVEMAEWARDHLAAQEPTDAECIAVLNAVTVPLGNEPRTDAEWMQAAIIRCREAMVNARAARRDEEKRYD